MAEEMVMSKKGVISYFDSKFLAKKWILIGQKIFMTISEVTSPLHFGQIEL